MSQRDDDLKLVRAACDALMEHFDSVQIFTTRYTPENNGTVHLNLGSGNWYARYGQIKRWADNADHEDQKGINNEPLGDDA